MSHKIDISVISQKAPNKKQRKEEMKRSKSHLPTKVLFNLTTKYAVVLVVQSLCRGFSVHGILRARIWSGLPFPSLGDLPNPGIEPRSPALQAILYQLSHEGSLRILEWVAYPLLQWIFVTQGLNWGLLHCRWIFYQLSYQGNPKMA